MDDEPLGCDPSSPCPITEPVAATDCESSLFPPSDCRYARGACFTYYSCGGDSGWLSEKEDGTTPADSCCPSELPSMGSACTDLDLRCAFTAGCAECGSNGWGPCDDASPSLAAIQSSILVTSCALGSACHGPGASGAPPAGFEQYAAPDGSFTSHELFAALVGIASTDAPDLKLVVADHPEESFLFAKITAGASHGSFAGTACDPAPSGGATCGSGMPLTGAALTADQIAQIEVWINQGALDN